jgi:pimeloyl-ACP methyl ester carboxylesterase
MRDIDVVILPATHPDDPTFGFAPTRVAAQPQARLHAVRFPGVVWYNRAVRDQAMAQIRGLRLASCVLVGFSKSGLGAWNLACQMADQVQGVIIFDAPLASDDWRRWGEEFYQDDVAWQEDLPLRQVRRDPAVWPGHASLVLISGSSFHAQMVQFAAALGRHGTPHQFLPRPGMPHHWDAGWLEQGLAALPGA